MPRLPNLSNLPKSCCRTIRRNPITRYFGSKCTLLDRIDIAIKEINKNNKNFDMMLANLDKLLLEPIKYGYPNNITYKCFQKVETAIIENKTLQANQLLKLALRFIIAANSNVLDVEYIALKKLQQFEGHHLIGSRTSEILRVLQHNDHMLIKLKKNPETIKSWLRQDIVLGLSTYQATSSNNISTANLTDEYVLMTINQLTEKVFEATERTVPTNESGSPDNYLSNSSADRYLAYSVLHNG